MLTTHLFRLGLQQRNVLRDRRGEGMMARIPTVLLLVEAQQRKINHPKKIEACWINHEFSLASENLRAIKTYLPQDLACIQPLIGREQDQIAFLDGQLTCERLALGLAEEL